ncbi:hypothetical protein JW707_00455 [Candidatus Woesearchaeota archaeon]|nr:hypothetical protein [Candidatus Woesearchaeota archaeon]
MRRKAKKEKKRHVWHGHFLPALIVGVVIVIITFFLDYFSAAGIDMLASIVASVVILTHRYRHRLTMLGTIISAYVTSTIFTVVLITVLRRWNVSLRFQLFAVLFLLVIILYWLNVFHPPAISFSIAFVFFIEGISKFFYVLFMAVVLFVGVRAVVYLVYDHLSIKDFVYEFIMEEEQELIKEERKIIRGIKRI